MSVSLFDCEAAHSSIARLGTAESLEFEKQQGDSDSHNLESLVRSVQLVSIGYWTPEVCQ